MVSIWSLAFTSPKSSQRAAIKALRDAIHSGKSLISVESIQKRLESISNHERTQKTDFADFICKTGTISIDAHLDMGDVISGSSRHTIINGRIIDTSDPRLILKGATEKTGKTPLVVLAARMGSGGLDFCSSIYAVSLHADDAIDCFFIT